MRHKLEELRGRPKEERRAIAAGAAIAVVAVLFIGWAVAFFKHVRNSSNAALGSGSSVDLSSFREAADGFSNTYADELERLREQASRVEEATQLQDESSSQQDGSGNAAATSSAQ